MKKFILLTMLVVTSVLLNAQVAINTDGSNADPSAMLDIKSDTAGILIPRMTAAQRDAINNPAQGLMVFVTDDSTFCYYHNSSWIEISSGENAWHVSGDTVSTVRKKRVGIGTSSPGATLDVAGHIWITNTGHSVFIGKDAGKNDVLGNTNYNTIIGEEAGYSNIDGWGNVAVGFYSLQSNMSSMNTALGGWALRYNDYGVGNTATGYQALAENTQGIYNTANGLKALGANTTGNCNVAVGVQALSKNTEHSFLVAVGDSALYHNGENAIFIYQAAYNTALGHKALFANNKGYRNTAVGYQTLSSNTVGFDNTALGYAPLSLITTGYSNIAIGTYAGRYMSDSITANDKCIKSIFLGTNTKSYENNDTNEIVIGYHAIGNGSNSVTLGNENVNKTILRGRVGIGTKIPNVLLQINDTTTNDTTMAIIKSGSNDGVNTGCYYINDNSGSGSHIGFRSDLKGTGEGMQIGSYQEINNSGYGYHYGSYNTLSGVGSGKQYGSLQLINGIGNGEHFGCYNLLEGTGTGNKFGSYNSILTTAGGTHYGVYSEAEGSSNYAGYFKGRMYVSDSTGIGTDSATALLDINGSLRLRDGTQNNGYVLISDVNGFASWADKTSVNNSLDEAYDKGGAGAGKNITADAGAVRINGTDGFLVTGTYGSGTSIDSEITGAGTRMFFNPNKSAFRAGVVYGNQWDNDSLGSFSVAMGYNTKALAQRSTAFGNETRAEGASSTAMGSQTNAIGNGSVAIGSNSIAQGRGSSAFGWGTHAYSFDETVVGSYNTAYTPADINFWNSNDRLFVVGNGADASHPSNALSIYKDGRFNINDEYFMPQTDGTTGQVMQTDGAGQVSFVDPSTVSGWTISGNNLYTLTSNVGIGLSLPSAKLAIYDTATPTAFSINNSYNDNNIHRGINNHLTGAGTGKQYGIYTLIDNTSDQNHFGSYCNLSGSGSGAKYGFYAYIASSTGGNHYGVYSYAPGSTNYAGYFNGRLYAGDKVGIGVLTPGAKLDVAGAIWQTSTGQSVFLGENAGANDDFSNNYNVFVGYNAGTGNTTGYDNTAIGYKAMEAVTDGHWNTALGHFAYQTGNYSNSTAIGDGVAITASNQVRIGHNVSSIGGPQNWTNTSDGRFKFDIKENVPGIEFIKKLRPVTYHLDVDKLDRYTGVPEEYKNDPVAKQAALKSTTQLRTGFIAQEVEKAAQSVGYNFSGVDAPKNSKDVYGLRYAEFVVPLVKAVQQQQQTIEQQQKTINDLSKRLEYLEKMMDNN